jgi:hypothetical protein
MDGGGYGKRTKTNRKSWRALTELLTRARIEGLIPWESLDDENRPIDLNEAWDNPAEFFRQVELVDHMRSSANGGTVRGNPEARRPSKRGPRHQKRSRK